MKNLIKASLKTIIKQTLLAEMDLQGMLKFSDFDDKVRARMLRQINSIKETDPKKYEELQKEIEKNVVDLILSRIGGEAVPNKTPPPAARNSVARARLTPYKD